MPVSRCAPSPTARRGRCGGGGAASASGDHRLEYAGLCARSISFSACASAHAAAPIRLIILSACRGEQDIVTGLNLGADDYIAKPFSLREVLARVSAVLRPRVPSRRRRRSACDDLVLDAATNRVTRGGERQLARRRISAAGVFHVASRANLQSHPAACAGVGRRQRSGRANGRCERAAPAEKS